MARRKGDIVDVQDPEGNFLEEGDSVLVPEVEDDFPAPSPETDALREQIKNLTQSISNCYWDLSNLVWKVNKERLYKTWGYSDFVTWTQEELGFQKRKAYYLIQFQDYCSVDLKQLLPQEEYDNAISQLKEVGWSKALEIAKEKILTKDNWIPLLEEAKEDKIDEFVQKIKLIKDESKPDSEGDGVTGNTMKTVKRTFKLTTTQEEILQNALEKAKVILNRDEVSEAFALEYVCADFAANAGSDIQMVLSNIERIYGVSVVAFSGDHQSVIFGADTLKAMGGE